MTILLPWVQHLLTYIAYIYKYITYTYYFLLILGMTVDRPRQIPSSAPEVEEK